MTQQSEKKGFSRLLYAAALMNCVRLFLVNFVSFDISEALLSISVPKASAYFGIVIALCLSVALVLYARQTGSGILAVAVACVSVSELLTSINAIGFYINFSQMPDIIVLFRILINLLVFAFGVVTVVGLLKKSKSTFMLALFAALFLFSTLWDDVIAGTLSSVILTKHAENAYLIINSLICSVASILVGVSILMISLQRAEKINT